MGFAVAPYAPSLANVEFVRFVEVLAAKTAPSRVGANALFAIRTPDERAFLFRGSAEIFGRRCGGLAADGAARFVEIVQGKADGYGLDRRRRGKRQRSAVR
jgi:hypothetical protein